MTNQDVAAQARLADILKLARLQLNEEFMSAHSSSQAAWLTSARSAWTSTGVLLPFSTKFVYPTEEEVVARGVKIYNSLNPQLVPQTATVQPPLAEPVTSIVQAGGDFVLIEEPVEEPVVETIADIVEEPVVVEEPIVNTVEDAIAIEPPAAGSLLENKFKSLFTKWGGKGNY
jgi:hypothetical protein